MKTITKQQRDQLVNLRAEADKLWQKLEEIEESALEITGEGKGILGGYTFDYIFNGLELKELFEILKIKVKKTTKKS